MRSHKAFVDLAAFDLGRLVISGILAKLILTPQWWVMLVWVLLFLVRTSNIARECVLGSGISETVPAHTVFWPCISSNVAATQVADMVQLGRLELLFWGVDTCSDPPIRISQKLRKALVKLEKVKRSSRSS